MNRPPKMIAAAALATLLLLSLDLFTKSWATDLLSETRHGEPPPVCMEDANGRRGTQRVPKLSPDDALVIVEDYFELRYAENCGAAFGLLDDQPTAVRRTVFGLAGVIATIVLFALFVRGSGGQLFAYSVPLIVSGAVGNLVDRARLGYVVDFIHFHWRDEWAYPTFNVADITITIGVALLVIDGVVQERAQKAAAAEEARIKRANAPKPRGRKQKAKHTPVQRSSSRRDARTEEE